MAKGKRHRFGLTVATLLPIVALLTASVVASNPSERAMYALVDQARNEHVLTALEVRSELAAIAERQAERMAKEERIWHNPDLAGDIRSTEVDWRRVGENVGAGFDLERIQRALIKSPSHKENLLDSRFNAIGIGVAQATDERLYVAQVFAWIDERTPTPEPSVTPGPTPTHAVAEDGSRVGGAYYTSTREEEPSTRSTSDTRSVCAPSSSAEADPSSETGDSSGTHDLHPAK